MGLGIFESKGTKRALGILFLVLGSVADALPVLAPYKELIVTIGGVLGVTGVAHATLAKK